MNSVRSLNWLVASALLFSISTAGAEVIFEENFDDQPDYVSRDVLSQGSHQLYRANGDSIPEGWDSVSDWSMYSEPHLAILASDAGKARGGTGKALVMRRGSRSGGWGGDAQLAKNFDQGYDELYVKFWIKFQPGWSEGDAAQSKLFRMGWYPPEDLTGSSYWSNLPMGIIWDWRTWTMAGSGLRNLIAVRPSDGRDFDNPNIGDGEGGYDGGKINGNYGSDTAQVQGNDTLLMDYVNGGTLPTSGSLTHAQVFSDVWHKMEFHIKLNSAPGVRDGVIQQWMDDVKLVDYRTVPWIQNNDPEPDKKFNSVKFGGNDNWMEYPNADEVQEWYAIDDIVIRSSLPIESTGIAPNPPTNIVID